MPLLPNRSGEQVKEERASKASIGSHLTLIADFINAIDPERKCDRGFRLFASANSPPARSICCLSTKLRVTQHTSMVRDLFRASL